MSASPVERVAARLATVPYARFIGMGVTEIDGELITLLPFSELIIGNTMLPAIHGGVVGAFLELTALIRLAADAPEVGLPRTIDITIDYLRPARGLTTHGRALVKKAGRRIASVHVDAYQDDPANPVAVMRGHFMLATGD